MTNESQTITSVPSFTERIKALPHDVVVSELILALCVLNAIGADDDSCDSTIDCNHCFAYMQHRLMVNSLLGVVDDSLTSNIFIEEHC